MTMTSIAKALHDELIKFRQCVPFTEGHDGNIGVFRYTLHNSRQSVGRVDYRAKSNPQIFGEDVFGASFTVYQEIRETLRDNFQEGCTIVTNAITGEDDFCKPTGYEIYAHEIKPFEGEDAKIIRKFYKAWNFRNYDSEYLLTNFLQNEIWSKDLGAGEFHLLTELPPCESCTNVLYDFLEHNIHSTLRIYHLKNPNKSSGDLSRLLNTGRAEVIMLDSQ